MNLRYTGQTPEKEVLQVIGKTFRSLLAEDPTVVYLDADLMGSLKTQDLWKEYPNNVFNCGIQEANMVGVACGMYLNGFKPYIHSFSPFASRRVFDQVFISGAYAHKSLRIIASDAGITATHNGGTHMCFEDIAMMCTVPEACVVDISDPTMMGAMMRITKDRPGITYLRTPRRGLPDLYMPEETFEIGKGKVLREGEDVTLIGCGIMVGTCLDAAKQLEAEGISARVVDMVTIKPLDEQLILESAEKTGAIVTAENANLHGGLGSMVCDCLAQHHPTPALRVAVEDQFGRVGVESYLRGAYGLTAENIVDKAKKVIAMRDRKR